MRNETTINYSEQLQLMWTQGSGDLVEFYESISGLIDAFDLTIENTGSYASFFFIHKGAVVQAYWYADLNQWYTKY